MKRANLVIGTRGSKLAIIYAENVRNELKKYFSNKIELKKIVTTGDQKHDQRSVSYTHLTLPTNREV